MTFLKHTFLLAAGALVFCTAGSAFSQELPKDANTTCPVMTKEEVDPDLHVDYKGERIYLCCTKCVKRFNQDPEKYVARVKAAKAKPAAAAKPSEKSAAPSL